MRNPYPQGAAASDTLRGILRREPFRAYAEILYSIGPKEVLAIKKRGEEMVFNYLLELNQKDDKGKNEKF